MVEYWRGRSDLLVDNPAPKNSVYVYGCQDCVIQVRKCWRFTIAPCTAFPRVGVVRLPRLR